MIRVGIVGTGFGQKIHLPGFQHLPGCEVVALVSRNRAKALATGVPLVFETIDELVQDPTIDLVSLTSPPHLHYAQALSVLQARKHLLCEKPVALNSLEAQAMLNAAETQGVVHGVDFEFRTVPHWCYLKELLDQQAVGQIRLIEGVWQVTSRADPQRPWNWYSQASQGGGALGAIGSHSFDYIEWLFGPVQRLSAHLSTAITTRSDDSGQPCPVDADDTCTIQFTLQDQTPGTLCLGTALWKGQGHWLRVHGAQGTLVVGSDNLKDYVHGFKLWRADPGQDLTEVVIPQRLAFPQIYQDGRLAPFISLAGRMLRAIETGTPMIPSLKEGLRSQILIDTARQSHQQGRWITV